ncbi:MAG: hypothetical protein L0H53_14555 [Candidatus Nitrosocosmicus sp.]|nr:hypothetical protein [Candidatus Nitrosocosmicus sp.]MDN5868766.1 hypothetical protein [Candidatus Nitrosocosmicus sp.]
MYRNEKIKPVKWIGVHIKYVILLNNYASSLLMNYLGALLISIALLIPVTQVAYGQNILDEIGEAFNNLTGLGNNNTNQTTGNNTSNSTSVTQSSNSTSNQSTTGQDQGLSNATDVENSTGSNKQIFTNNTKIDSNLTVGEGMEKSQLGNVIPGEQETRYEGQTIQNITNN